MAEFFEHGRRQLQAGDHAGTHPEADVLNAYMEGVLPERERAPLVAHLSQCAECREVVALAAPPMVDAARSSAGLRDPAMRLALWRWVVVATTAVVVLAAVLFNTDRGQPVPSVSMVAQAPAENAPAAAPAPIPESRKPAPAHDESASSELAKQAAAPRAGNKPGAGTMAQEQAQEKKNGQPKDAQLATAATDAGVVGNSPAGAAATDSFSAGARSDRKANLPAPAAVTLQAANETAPAAAPPAAPPKVERAMPSFAGALGAEPAEAAKMKSARAAAAPMSATVAEYSAPPRWSVSENGAVLRSTDAGRSWQTLRVGEGIHFRAVAAVGQQIWAGGNGGALFHSSDGGQTWVRLPLRVSGDITRATFSDALHGSVETSAGETWTTSDGGRNWQRR